MHKFEMLHEKIRLFISSVGIHPTDISTVQSIFHAPQETWKMKQMKCVYSSVVSESCRWTELINVSSEDKRKYSSIFFTVTCWLSALFNQFLLLSVVGSSCLHTDARAHTHRDRRTQNFKDLLDLNLTPSRIRTLLEKRQTVRLSQLQLFHFKLCDQTVVECVWHSTWLGSASGLDDGQNSPIIWAAHVSEPEHTFQKWWSRHSGH